MLSDIELLYLKDLNNSTEDENYIYFDAVVLVPGSIKRNYGKLLIDAKELKKSESTLKGKPVLIEHQSDVDSVVGQVVGSFFDESSSSLKAKLKILKNGNEKLIQLIKDKIITKLSAGFKRKLEQIEAGIFKAKDIEFQEVSIVLNPAVDQATFLKKEAENMSDIETLAKEKAILEREVESLKSQIASKEEESKDLTEKLSVLESEIETLKEMAEIGKKFEESLRSDAEKFVKIVEGDDSPILSLIGKAEIDELQNIVKKYESSAREKLRNTATSSDEDFVGNSEHQNFTSLKDIEDASYEELKKYEDTVLKGGN